MTKIGGLEILMHQFKNKILYNHAKVTSNSKLLYNHGFIVSLQCNEKESTSQSNSLYRPEATTQESSRNNATRIFQ